MQLSELETFVVAPPAPGWGGRYWIFTKLTTDDGIIGYGEVYASAVAPDVQVAVVRDVFERHMKGESPENIEKMFRRAYSSGFTQRPDPTVFGPIPISTRCRIITCRSSGPRLIRRRRLHWTVWIGAIQR